MRGRILDTNRLIAFWRNCERTGRAQREDPRRLGDELVKLEQTSAIVSPVYLEFLCGARSAEETRRYREFLEAFEVVDHWDVRRADWQRTQQLIQRVPSDGSPRHLVDCLIKALAIRLGYDILTSELRFPR